MKLIIALALAFAPAAATAQTEVEDDEITVAGANGEEEIIDVPEALDLDVDSLLALYNAKTYLTPGTDCNMTDVNPVFTREQYIERLHRLPNVIEMPYNDVVRKFIDRYSGRLRRSVSVMLGASNFYMPIFEQALEAYQLPLELKYLPVIESALNPRAVSRVGATGLWQFMIHTGKQYGLQVNSLVDERCDISKSTYAAARYLRDLWKIFGDWNLVIAAYNCGPEKINQAIHRAGGQKDYWQIYPYLPQETRGYVPAFIAANYIMNYYCEHNICPMVAKLPVKTDTVQVRQDVHFEQVADVLGISVDALRTLNPQYRHDLINPGAGSTSLRLPVALTGTFIDREDSVYAYNADVLLARRQEVAVNDAPAVQPTAKRGGAHGKKAKGKRGRKGKRGGRSVSVRNGDTLSAIAKRNGTTVAKLRRLNGIKGSSIRAGKKIKVR